MFELIFKPLNYLNIRWDNGIINKTRFDFIIPTIIALLISAVMTFIWFKIGSDKSNIFTNDITYYLICFFTNYAWFLYCCIGCNIYYQ